MDTNIVTLLFPDGRKIELEKMSKLDVANRVLDEVVEIEESPMSGVRSPKSKASSESDFEFYTSDFTSWTWHIGLRPRTFFYGRPNK